MYTIVAYFGVAKMSNVVNDGLDVYKRQVLSLIGRSSSAGSPFRTNWALKVIPMPMLPFMP